MCVCEHMTLVSVDGQHPSAQGEGGLRVGDTVGPLAMPATVKKGINKTKETMRKEKKQTKQIIRRRKRTGKKTSHTTSLCPHVFQVRILAPPQHRGKAWPVQCDRSSE